MKSDAKLGLIAGVAAVITIAVVYHHKPNPTSTKSTSPTKTVATSPASPLASVGLPAKPKTVVDNSDLD